MKMKNIRTIENIPTADSLNLLIAMYGSKNPVNMGYAVQADGRFYFQVELSNIATV